MKYKIAELRTLLTKQETKRQVQTAQQYILNYFDQHDKKKVENSYISH